MWGRVKVCYKVCISIYKHIHITNQDNFCHSRLLMKCFLSRNKTCRIMNNIYSTLNVFQFSVYGKYSKSLHTKPTGKVCAVQGEEFIIMIMAIKDWVKDEVGYIVFPRLKIMKTNTFIIMPISLFVDLDKNEYRFWGQMRCGQGEKFLIKPRIIRRISTGRIMGFTPRWDCVYG